MGKDFESWLHQRQPYGQFPNSKSLKLPFDLGMENSDIPHCAIPCTDAGPSNCASPAFGFSGPLNFKPGQLKEPHGWFYCLPRSRQAFMSDMTLHENILPKFNPPCKVPPAVDESCSEANVLLDGCGHTVKQFLVFDQTGNKTTMTFSSGIGAPIQQLSSWSLKLNSYYNESGDKIRIGSNENYHLGHTMPEQLNGDYGSNEGSEMREDTEEINALLYSDDDDDDSYSENGEETSTGHSPGMMTAYEKQEWFEEEDGVEVASSAGTVKRQKLSDSGYEAPSVTNGSSYVKRNRRLEYEDDAESSCAGGKATTFVDRGSLSGNKRVRKEKIQETVNILQTIIPGGKGKDAVMVLDEAISYLRTLKLKAKCLGLSAL